MKPTIAVCIPAHPARARNGMLDEALRSVWAQTLLPDAVHVAMDTTRAGAPATRQRALDAASCDWISFLDSDDLLLPQHLEHLLAHALATNADLVYSWFRLVQQLADGRRIDHGDFDPVFPPGHYLNPFDPTSHLTAVETTMTVIVRRELAQAVGMRALDRGEVNSGEDRAFTLDILDAGGRIEHLVERTWLWRHHQLPDGSPGNASGLASKGDAAVG